MNYRFIMMTLWLTACSIATAEAPESPRPQTITPGDAHVQSHLPVALVTDPEATRRLATALVDLTRGFGSSAAAIETTGTQLEIVWRAGTTEERVLPLDSGGVLLPIVPHADASYAYYLRARDARSRFEVRWPAAPDLYRIQAAAPIGPKVLDGTGDGQSAQGEMIPIEVKLASPERVKDVIVFHRSASSSVWTSAPMTIRTRTEAEATWSGSVPRPGGDPELQYYVIASGVDGRVTRYGVPEQPHRVKLISPALPAEADP